jgi:hypothetical protein
MNATRIYSVERKLYSTNGDGKGPSHIWKDDTRSHISHHIHTKKVCDTVKIIEENGLGRLQDTGIGKYF